MMILLLKRTNFGFKPKTGINFGGGFKHNITSTKTKFFQGIGIKRFNSYSNNDDVNTVEFLWKMKIILMLIILKIIF